MPAPIPNDARRLPRAGGDNAPPPPAGPGVFEGWSWDALGGAAGLAIDETPGRENLRRNSAYMAAIDALSDLSGEPMTAYMRGGWNMGSTGVDEDKFWRDLDRVRRQKPDALKGWFADRASFDAQYAGAVAQGRAANEASAATGGLAVQIAGGAAGAMVDPVNVLSLPLGGGKVVTSGVLALGERFLREGATNAGLEAFQQPFVAQERVAQQREALTLGEAAENVGLAGVGGGALGATFEAAGRGAARAVPAARDAFESAVAANWEKIPEPLRKRWEARATVVDADGTETLLADMAEAVIEPGRMSEAERDALAVIRREAAVARGNPFVRSGAGEALHPEMLGAAIDRIVAANPQRAPVVSAAPVMPREPGGAAVAEISAARAGPAFEPGQAGASERFMARVRSAESSGNDAAKAKTSSATGRYQFIGSTWLHYYKRRFGATGESNAAILAKRGDGALQDRLMQDLTADNAAFLRSQGEAVSEGNLYLTHFAGPGGAKRIFAADPNTPIESVLPAAAINANGFLRGKTAGEVIAWAHAKMDAPAPRRAGAGPRIDSAIARIDSAIARNESERASIQDALDEAVARADALAEAQRAARAPADDQFADAGNMVPLPEPVRIDGDDFAPEVPLIDGLRAAVGSKRDLNDVEGLARDLGADANDVRVALQRLVGLGELRVSPRKGFVRKRAVVNRTPRAKADANELLEFIAKGGGLRDDEGHGLGLTGISPREKRELHPAILKNVKRARTGAGSRNWKRMTRSHGPLLRHEGQSVDRVGEALWEAGWFGDPNLSPRPTEAQVLDLIESRIQSGQPMFPPGYDRAPGAEGANGLGDDGGSAELDWARDEELRVVTDELFGLAREWQLDPADFPDGLLERAAAMTMADRELTQADALLRAIDQEFVDAARAGFDETDDLRYEDIDDDWPFASSENPAPAGAGGADGDIGGGRAGEPGNADAGGPGGAALRSDAEIGESLAALPEAERTAFLDPDGKAAQAQADSLEHDARAVLDAANLELADSLPSPDLPAADGAVRWLRERAQRFDVTIGDLPNGGRYAVRHFRFYGNINRGFLHGLKSGKADDLAELTGEWGAKESLIFPKRQSDSFVEYLRTEHIPLDDLARNFDTARWLAESNERGSAENLDNGEAVDPAITERQRQEAALAAAAPMRARAEQDGTMGSPLFDAVDQPGFRLDLDGEERGLGDLLDEFDAEGADLGTIRECL